MRRSDIVVVGAAVAAAVATIIIGVATAHAGPSCYLEGSAGGQLTSHKFDNAGGSVTIAGNGYTGGVGVGCDLALDKVLIGAVARYDLEHVKTKFAPDAILSQDAAWTVAARAGIRPQEAILVYGMVGLTGTDFKAGDFKLSRQGTVFGGGLELEMSRHFAIFAEYNRTLYGAWTDGTDSLKPATDAIRLGGKFRFSSILEPAP